MNEETRPPAFVRHEDDQSRRERSICGWRRFLISRHDPGVARWELYDMVADRTETTDLAGEHPDRVRQMAAAWTAWAERTGAIHQLGKKYRLKPNAPG